MSYQPIGSWRAELRPSQFITAKQIRGETINGQEIVISGGRKGKIRSRNYVEDTAGWIIRGDGSAEFQGVVILGAGTIIGADLYSDNWDGDIPANLATVDTGATAGYYLDHSVGSSQWMGDIFVGGTIIIGDTTVSALTIDDGRMEWQVPGAVNPPETNAYLDVTVTDEGGGVQSNEIRLNSFVWDGVPDEGQAFIAMRAGSDYTLVYPRINIGFTSTMVSLYPVDSASIWYAMDLAEKTLISGTDLQLRVGDGTASLPTYGFENDWDSGMYRVGANIIGFATNGVAKAQISTTAISVTPLGTESVPSLSWTADLDTGFFSGTNSIGITTGGTRRILIDSAKTQFDNEVRFTGDASAASPNINWANDQDTGIYRVGGGEIGVSINGVLKQVLSGRGLGTDYSSNDLPRVWFSQFGSHTLTNTTTWEAIGTTWSKAIGTARPVSVVATASVVLRQGSSATSRNARAKCGISTDGGSTWTYGSSARIDDISTAAGVNTRVTVSALCGVENVTPSGNVQVRVEMYANSLEVVADSADVTITMVGDI